MVKIIDTLLGAPECGLGCYFSEIIRLTSGDVEFYATNFKVASLFKNTSAQLEERHQ